MNLVDTLREVIRDFYTKYITNVPLTNTLTIATMVLFWLVLGFIVIKITKLIVLRSSKLQDKGTKESLTMARLINSLIRVLFIFWIVIMVLQELGIEILPVLAGAGVIAFAIGFGAQELTKDVISGFFLILEKTFRIGDVVEIGGNKGYIEDIGLRRTKLRTFTNEIITINNGDIKKVINFSLEPGVAIIDFNIDFRQDIEIFESEEFTNFVKAFAEKHPDVTNEGSAIIVVSLLGGHVTLRVTFDTDIRRNIVVERDFMKELLKFARDHSIDLEVPYVVEHDNLKQ
ncbi:MAG: mechanosensitive ion channel [Acholeplasmatales bacterium]|jgi:small conductance mechanosensitive channel|nr:mechanosensitive ion channel [Acholeplasmatales bacterium]